MSSMILRDVTVDFPIFNAKGRKLTNQLIKVATGGQLGKNSDGKVVVQALQHINIELQDGDRLGLIGHNGAGKSTLLRVLAGVYEPSKGTIQRDGEIGSLVDIGLGINGEATGRENIFLRAALLGIPKKVMLKKFDEIVAFSELGEFIDLPVRTYSTGMHLRLAFAVATSIEPNILVMDEWLSVGDESFQHRAEQRMGDLVNRTNILILASHSRALIEQTCNKIMLLEHGSGQVEEISEQGLDKYFGKK